MRFHFRIQDSRGLSAAHDGAYSAMRKILIDGQRGETLNLLGHILVQEGYQVRFFEGRTARVAKIKSLRPDVLILDAVSSASQAADICRQVRRERCLARLRIVVLNPTDGDAHGGDVSADLFIDRPLQPIALLAALRELLQQKASDDEPKAQIRAGDLVIDPFTYRVSRAGTLLPLTAMEFRLLYHLASHPNAICRRDRLLSAVWGVTDITPRTVDVVIRHLRTKIEPCSNSPQLIRSVRGQGYSFHMPRPDSDMRMHANREVPLCEDNRRETELVSGTGSPVAPPIFHVPVTRS